MIIGQEGLDKYGNNFLFLLLYFAAPLNETCSYSRYSILQ